MTADKATEGPTAPIDLRNGNRLRALLATSAAEGFGDALTRTVLPILAVSALGLGTGYVGLLNATSLIAFLLLGVPIGLAVDRLRSRKQAMGAASILRVLVLTALVGAFAFEWLSAPALMTAAVLIGVADVVFTTAQGAIIPALVGPERLKAAFSRLAVVNQSTSTAAAAAASALLGLIGLPGLLLAAAAAYLASCWSQILIRVAPMAPSPVQRTARNGQLTNGFRTLRSVPALWALTMSACLTNAGAMLGNTLLPVYVLRDLSIDPAVFAALGVLAAAGAIAGSAVSPRLSGLLGLRKLRILTALLSVPAVFLVAACTWLPGAEVIWLSLEAFAWSFLVSVAAVAGAEVLPTTVARHELASVGSAQRMITLGVMPVAALAGGLVGAVVGTIPLVFAWMMLAGLASVPILRNKTLSRFR